MASKTVFTQVKTTQSLEEVTDAVVIALRRLGGQVLPRGSTIEVIDGNAGVSVPSSLSFRHLLASPRIKRRKILSILTVRFVGLRTVFSGSV